MTEHPDDLLHIASCHTCRDRFTADNVVNFNGDQHRGPERMREFLETARRLERERDGVEDLVACLLRTTPPSEWSALAAAPELHSSAAVEQLIEEVRHRVERTPADALTLANVATTIAESLPPSSYPAVVLAQLCAMAWKERANTLRYLSRFDDALASIETAEQRLERFASAAFDRAVVQLSRAIIVHHLKRVDEAYELIRDAREVFRDYGDSKMILIAGLIEAGHLYYDGRYVESEALFRDVQPIAERLRDVDSLARIEHNLGHCAIQAGNFREANIHFSNGIALFNELGCTVEANRAELGAGRVLIAKGQVNSGLSYLRNARRKFADCGMPEEAAISGLEIVQTLLERGDESEGRQLAQTIAREVERAGLSQRAITALRRLDDKLAEGGADAAVHVRSAQEILQSLQEQRATPAQ